MMSLKVGSFTLPPIGHPRCAGPRMQPELCAQEPTIFFLSLSEFPLYARPRARVGLWEPGTQNWLSLKTKLLSLGEGDLCI